MRSGSSKVWRISKKGACQCSFRNNNRAFSRITKLLASDFPTPGFCVIHPEFCALFYAKYNKNRVFSCLI